MEEGSLLVSLSAILAVGILAQWVAWRLRLPSILVLLLVGFIVGPITGWINPDALLGELLTPVVSVSVGIILFEGGLTLRFGELRQIGSVVRNLVSIGALLTWLLISAASYYILGYDIGISILLGAILVVTGPTVIGPMLRHMGPIGQVGSALKWEGIVIDPIGATLAVLVFEALLEGTVAEGTVQLVLGVVRTVIIGGGFGLLGTLIMTAMLRRGWIPESLDVPFTLMVVVMIFSLSGMFQAESGLLATTVMGIGLANQRYFAVKHILEFKENLRVLLIAALFILLAARLPLDDVITAAVDPRTWLFLLVVMLIVRPLSVAASTVGSTLSIKERVLLAWVAPRGIVAASVSSIFALELMERGFPQASDLTSMTFIVIVITVMVYGLTAGPLASWLGLSAGHPQGMLFVGAHGWARAIALVVQAAGFPVLLADSNRANATAAQMEGLDTFFGNIIAGGVQDILNLDGFGRLVALTANDEINSLAALHFAETFGRQNVYQLDVARRDDSQGVGDGLAQELRGKTLFGQDVTFHDLDHLFADGAVVKRTTLTPQFTYEDLKVEHAGKVVPLFVITAEDRLAVLTEKSEPPQAGQAVIFVTMPKDEAVREINRQSHSAEAQHQVG